MRRWIPLAALALALAASSLLAPRATRAEDAAPPSGDAPAAPAPGETPAPAPAEAPPPEPDAPPGVRNTGPERPLRLAEAVQMALRSNLGLAAGRIDPSIAGAAYQAERAIFDPLVSAAFDYLHNEDPSISAFLGRDVVTSDLWTGSAGVTQLLPSGGTARLLYRLDRTATDQAFTTISPAWGSGIGLEGTQPLLRGAGDVVMASIRRAHNDVVASRETLRALRESTILQVSLSYWDLVRLQEDLVARIKSEQTAAELLRDARARFEGGVGTPLDVAEALAGLEERRGSRIAAQGLLARQQDLLRTLILPFTPTDVQGVRFVAVDDVMRSALAAPDPAQLERYTRTAIQNRPELRAADAGLGSRSIDVTVAANGVLPQLDVVGTVGTDGLRGLWYDSFGEMATGQAVSAGVGVRFSMYVGQRAARSRLRLAQWARRQAHIRYRELESSIVDEVRAGVRTVLTAQAVLETAQAQVAAAEEGLRGERQLLAQGRSTPYRVLQKETDLTSARLRLATAAAGVRQAEASFWRSVGMLGESLGVGAR